MQTITVDMTPGFRQPTIHYSQNDVGTTFAIDLRSRFGDTLPASPTVKIQATKPSGFGFSIEADSVVGTIATFTTVATMTDEAGRFQAELEVSDSGVVLYTANFYMEGEANPHPIGTTDGSQETIIPTLTLLVERVEAAAASVNDLTVSATTLPAGSDATAVFDSTTDSIAFGIPRGADGEVTEAELDAAISDVKSALNVVPHFSNELSYAITSDMLEEGRIDDSGLPASNSSRCRTKYFLPVSKGDVIIAPYIPSGTISFGYYISYYDTSKTFVSNSSWYHFHDNANSHIPITSNGYIKVTFGANNISGAGGLITLSLSNINEAGIQALEAKLQTTVLPIPSANFENGAWINNSSNVFTVSGTATRARTTMPIPVKKGDEIHFTFKNSILANIGFKIAVNTDPATFTPTYNNMPYKAPSDGYVYINFKKSDNSAITDFSSWDKAVTIKRAKDIGLVESVSSADLFNGYINEGDSYNISSHASRLVNWNPIHANKGDIIRMNRLDVEMIPYEFDQSKNCLAKASTYITPQYVGGSYQECGDYIVQNDDCWVMCTIAPVYGTSPESFLPEDYGNAISVVHIEKSRNINVALDTMWHFPKSARKPKPFVTSAIVSQGATVVNGNLWVAVDNSGTYSIQVIDIESGNIIKTISHNLGHCNCLDYCEETDTLMTVDSTNDNTILLYPNASSAGNSMSKSDCISISIASDVSFFGSCCFGQDHREVFIFCGASGGGNPESTTPYYLHKIVLGYSSNGYNGTYDYIKLFKGVIRDNIDTYVTKGTTRYAQDSCYDGYLYLAYGTSGHNFLVLDIDENQNTYRVVGNYLHHEYDDNYDEYHVEPEGVALYNSKVFCLSRVSATGMSFFNIFDR